MGIYICLFQCLKVRFVCWFFCTNGAFGPADFSPKGCTWYGFRLTATTPQRCVCCFGSTTKTPLGCVGFCISQSLHSPPWVDLVCYRDPATKGCLAYFRSKRKPPKGCVLFAYFCPKPAPPGGKWFIVSQPTQKGVCLLKCSPNYGAFVGCKTAPNGVCFSGYFLHQKGALVCLFSAHKWHLDLLIMTVPNSLHQWYK